MLLYVGIIDILQSYQIKKKLEHGLKSLMTDGVGRKNKLVTINYYYHCLVF